MASVVNEIWRSVPAVDIDTALPDLWRDAAQDGPVSRALMSNLVVVREGAGLPEHGVLHLDPASDIVGIGERHPARFILLNYSPAMGPPCAPTKANIGVLAFGAGTVRYGVEVIAVDAECTEPSVPSIVRRLTRGEVPTTLWWTEDMSRIPPPSAMVQTGRQLLYDSAAWQDIGEGARIAAALLAVAHAPDLADLNWQRLAPLRWALVQALRTEPRATSLAPAGVTIRYRPGERAAGWLLAAWLRARLRWSDSPTVEELRSDDLVRMMLAGDGWEVTAAINRQRVEVACGGRQPPFTVPVPRRTIADTVVAELRSLGRDVYLGQTVAMLAGLPL